MRLPAYLRGPTICGFWGLVESDFGNPSTPSPYARITPSRLGDVILPFRCPYCERICKEFTTPEQQKKYHDTRTVTTKLAGRPFTYRRNNYWCPGCKSRFFLNLPGTELKTSLLANAEVAPSVVERREVTDSGEVKTTVAQQDLPVRTSIVGTILGTLFGKAEKVHHGVDVLGALYETPSSPPPNKARRQLVAGSVIGTLYETPSAPPPNKARRQLVAGHVVGQAQIGDPNSGGGWRYYGPDAQWNGRPLSAQMWPWWRDVPGSRFHEMESFLMDERDLLRRSRGG